MLKIKVEINLNCFRWNGKNAMLAPALARILEEAELEVPGFLCQFGSSFGGPVSASGDGSIGAVPVDEEEW
jgi:hypothetical protein